MDDDYTSAHSVYSAYRPETALTTTIVALQDSPLSKPFEAYTAFTSVRAERFESITEEGQGEDGGYCPKLVRKVVSLRFGARQRTVGRFLALRIRHRAGDQCEPMCLA